MTNRKYEKLQKKFQQSPYRMTEKSKSIINQDFDQENENNISKQNFDTNENSKPLIRNESKKSSTADLSNRKNLKLIQKMNKTNGSNNNVSNSV